MNETIFNYTNDKAYSDKLLNWLCLPNTEPMDLNTIRLQFGIYKLNNVKPTESVLLPFLTEFLYDRFLDIKDNKYYVLPLGKKYSNSRKNLTAKSIYWLGKDGNYWKFLNLFIGFGLGILAYYIEHKL